MCEGKKKIRYGNYYYIWDSKYIKNQSIDPTYLFFSEFIESIFREFKNQHLGWIDGSIVVWLVSWVPSKTTFTTEKKMIMSIYQTALMINNIFFCQIDRFCFVTWSFYVESILFLSYSSYQVTNLSFFLVPVKFLISVYFYCGCWKWLISLF